MTAKVWPDEGPGFAAQAVDKSCNERVRTSLLISELLCPCNFHCRTCSVAQAETLSECHDSWRITRAFSQRFTTREPRQLWLAASFSLGVPARLW